MRRFTLYRENSPKRIAADLGIGLQALRRYLKRQPDGTVAGGKHRGQGVFGG